MNRDLLLKGLCLSIFVPIYLSGCGNPNPEPEKPGFKDGSPPVPVVNEGIDNSNIPTPLGLNKGAAKNVFNDILKNSVSSYNINQKLKLETLLTGYYSFESYVFEAQIFNDGTKVDKIYAKDGFYDENINKFVIKTKDITSPLKKNLIV